VIGLHPGLVQTELVDIPGEGARARQFDGGADGHAGAMMIYFAACEDAREYSGRIFFAEREMAAMGIEPDQ